MSATVTWPARAEDQSTIAGAPMHNLDIRDSSRLFNGVSSAPDFEDPVSWSHRVRIRGRARRAVLHALASECNATGEVQISVEELSLATGIDARHVRRCLVHLEDRGLISRVHCYRNGFQRPSLYVLSII